MIKSLLTWFFRIVQICFFPYKLYESLKGCRRIIRSLWLRPSFASCGKSVFFGKIGRVHGTKCISIAEGSFFDDFFYLTAWPELVKNVPVLKIGENCSFGAYSHITCTNKITIGNHCLTGKWVTISDNNHGDSSKEALQLPPSQREMISKGPVIIEDNVWIGDKATVLSGVSIGKGAIVAANAVVTKDVPAFCVVAGNPAKIIRKVNDENEI